MNRETLDMLLAAERTEISDSLADLIDDTHVSAAITYRDWQSKTRTPSTGAFTNTYTDYSIRAVRGELSAREVQAGAGLYQVGDIEFMIAQSDLSITPHREDRITSGSTTYEVIDWKADPLDMTWTVIARRVA